MTLTRWKPFGELHSLHDRINRLFENELKRDLPQGTGFDTWYPAADIYETKDDYVFKLEVPGLARDDVDVEFHDSVLTIKGEKKTEKEVKEENYHRIESYSGSFTALITLTDDQDIVLVSADANQEVEESNEGNNLRGNVLSWPPKPDLVVSEKHEERADAGVYRVYFTIFNPGNSGASTEDASLTVDGIVIETLPVPALDQGKSYSGSFATAIPLTDGLDSVVVCTDIDNEVVESLEVNNCYENTYAWPPAPDLIMLSKTEHWVSEGVYVVYFLVQNIGNATAAPPGYDVTLTVDGTLKETMEVPVLTPGSIYPGIFATEIALSGDTDEITVCADASAEIAESREDNNCQTNTWPMLLVSIDVTPTNPFIDAGKKQQFTAIGTYADTSTADLTHSVTWSSSNTAVAIINAAGLAKSYAEGTTMITATSGNVSDNSTLTVGPRMLCSISIRPVNPAVTFASGSTQTLQFRALAYYSDGWVDNVSGTANWTSDNISVATIEINTGVATILASGIAGAIVW